MNPKIISTGFFLVVFLLGLFIYKDYGISLDEPAQRLIGIVNANYVAQVLGIQNIIENPHFANFTTQTLTQIKDRHYGVIFELPAALLELFLNPNDPKTIYEARHLLTFIYFLVGLIALYGLANLRFKNWKISLLACSMLLLSPRFFADAFYNDKDIVFLSAYALSALTMIHYLIEPTFKRGLVHALATAIAIDTRLISIAIPLLTIFLLAIESSRREGGISKILKSILLYLFTSILFTIVLFPYLWANPVKHLIEAFYAISQNLHSGSVMYMGTLVPNHKLPWHYLPVWIAISTPILYTAFFCFGALLTFRQIYRLTIFKNQNQLIDFIFLGLFIGPIIAVASSHTHIYNGWRHLYFVYPFFILIAIKGIQTLWQILGRYKYCQSLMAITFIINFCYVGGWMYVNHPLQNLYFNILAGKSWSSSYEIDYWGLANRIALQKILSQDSGNLISIWPGTSSKFKSGEPTVFSDQLLMEKPFDASRVISPANIEDSKYIIASRMGNYSMDYLSEHGALEKLDSVTVDGKDILNIFKFRRHGELPTPKKNQKISFSKNGIGIFYLYGDANPPLNWEVWKSNNWQIPESWGAWSNGKNTSVVIPLPNDGASKLTIQLRAFVTPQVSKQNIEIWINGQLAREASMASNQSQELVIDLPEKLNPKKEVLIEFKGLNPQSPKAIGLSQDDRQIAIGLESILFK
jgi:hypothetical protein